MQRPGESRTPQRSNARAGKTGTNAGNPKRGNKRSSTGQGARRTMVSKPALNKPTGRTTQKQAPKKQGRQPVSGQGGAKRKNKKRRSSAVLIYFMVFLLVIGVGVVLSFTVLFPIQTIEVQGNTRYSQQEILDVSGIQTGENLFIFDKEKAVQAILEKLPFIEQVQIRRVLPGAVVITVEDASPAYAFLADDTYYIVSAGGKILDALAKRPDDLLLVVGAALETPAIGEKLSYTDEKQMQLFKTLLLEIENQAFTGITQMDITNTVEIAMQYENRIVLLFGTSNDLSYKISYAKKLLSDQLEKDAKGRLDLSRLSAGNGDAYFREDKSEDGTGNNSSSDEEQESSGNPVEDG